MPGTWLSNCTGWLPKCRACTPGRPSQLGPASRSLKIAIICSSVNLTCFIVRRSLKSQQQKSDSHTKSTLSANRRYPLDVHNRKSPRQNGPRLPRARRTQMALGQRVIITVPRYQDTACQIKFITHVMQTDIYSLPWSESVVDAKAHDVGGQLYAVIGRSEAREANCIDSAACLNATGNGTQIDIKIL
jgi:hypothetical protein